jgi:hypothetical protein
MPLSFQCRSCGQKLELPEDVETPVVICPTCGELIAVRDEPRPAEIPERPEHSEAITPERPPDHQDVISRPASYRSPLDPLPHEPRPGSPDPGQHLRDFVLFVLLVVLVVFVFSIVFLPSVQGGPPRLEFYATLFVPFGVLSLLFLGLWRVQEGSMDESDAGCLAGCIWFLGGVILLFVVGMVLLLVVCSHP